MRRLGGTAAAVFVAIAALGCGDSKADGERASAGDDQSGATTTTAAGGGSVEAARAGGGSSAAAGSAASSGSGSAAGTPGQAGGVATPPVEDKVGSDVDSELEGVSSEPMPIEASLAMACVRPGATQTVTVRAEPNSAVGYDTTWSDGKNGWQAADRGGSGNGRIDESGTWKNTWTVGATAPKGKAVVEFVGVDLHGRFARKTLEFAVSDALGKCS